MPTQTHAQAGGQTEISAAAHTNAAAAAAAASNSFPNGSAHDRMTIETALAALDVRDDTLSPDEKAQLDRDGFLALRGVLNAAQIEALRRRQDELLADEGEEAGKEVHQEAGTDTTISAAAITRRNWIRTNTCGPKPANNSATRP